MNILLRKLTRLGRDEDGAALIVTLALFMFMYLSCAAVFATGRTVKDKIHLQNAADAAAYSAAVVQADTLSRIATINRAMAWTYISLCHREMDYIVNKWLDESCDAYRTNLVLYSPYVDAFKVAGSERMKLNENNAISPTYSNVNDKVKSGFPKWWREDRVMSFYSKPSILEDQIDDDKKTIKSMNEAEENLIKNMHVRMAVATKEILKANVPQEFQDNYRWFLMHDGKGADDNASPSYIERMKSSREDDFVAFADDISLDKKGWYALSSGDGFKRDFNEISGVLCSDWFYSPDRNGESWIPHDTIKASDYDDEYYHGEKASPRILNDSYFGEAGTITVGLARYNENPWYAILKSSAGVGRGVLSGIYAAFNHYTTLDWTWAFSSAKAGYKYKDEEVYSRAYRIDWNGDNQEWNLCQSDWDAVFVPVRRAEALASDGAWGGSDAPSLGDWIEGGDWQPLGDGAGTPAYNVSGLKFMAEADFMHGGGGSINWNRLAEMFYH